MKTFHIKFYENRKIFIGISAAVILIGIICNIIFGTQLDIQFKGGAVIRYSFSGEIDQEDVQRIVQDASSL